MPAQQQAADVVGDFMDSRLSIILLIVFASCNPRRDNQAVVKQPSDSSKIKIDASSENVFVFDTVRVNGFRLVKVLNTGRFTCLLTLKGDTIVGSKDFYSSVEFSDIDCDGYKDIRVFVVSNTPNQCDNYLYDKSSRSFKRIQNSDLDIERIKGTKYYFSYARAGCSDINWESYLSKIENWGEIHIGLMNARGCGDKNDGIEIFKFLKEDTILVAKLPRIKFDNNGAYNKWAYLKSYWTKHHRIFD